MKRSSIIETRRMHVNPLIRQNVDLSFQIVDRIHEILVAKGLKQKDLASLLGKKEAEISKWMRGTHNFTIDTLVSIEKALGAPILQWPANRYRPLSHKRHYFQITSSRGRVMTFRRSYQIRLEPTKCFWV